ncbi:glycosyltransferase family 2 protein [Companilactobacillus mindensis]|nr:glycosyltransferase family 2 protein [Companilactobacillus mindensis]GEO79341.1 hypothetical protein LMI01_16720 [Companilactobacillus mindensis]
MIVYLTALVTFILQCSIMFYFYFRKQKQSMRQLINAYTINGSLNEYLYFILIPCLNEGKVIKRTLQKLLKLSGRKEIIVIDDDSDDDTLAQIRSVSGPISIIERKLPNARTGKGDSLNSAMPTITKMIHEQKLDPARCIVGVVDADGALSANSFYKLTNAFENNQVDSVQLRVKMRNPHTILQTFQDIEFFVVNHLIQTIRAKLNAVALCGNGQFFRYSTIVKRLGEKPWGNALLEDYELTLRMEFKDIKTQYISDAYVDQEALTSVKRLIKQRARWAQGGFNCLKYLGHIIHSKDMPESQKLDAYFFFFQPIINVLADFSIMFLTIAFIRRNLYKPIHLLTLLVIMVFFGLFFGLAFTMIYLREIRLTEAFDLLPKLTKAFASRRLTPLKVILAIFLVSYIYAVLFLSMMTAIYHLIIGQHTWDKTKRL